MASAGAAAHPGCLKGAADAQLTRAHRGLPECAPSACPPPPTRERTGACAGVVSACWEPVRHGGLPLQTHPTRGALTARLLGCGSFTTGTRSWQLPRKGDSRVPADPMQGHLLLTRPQHAANRQVGAEDKSCISRPWRVPAFLSPVPLSQPPEAQEPSDQQELPRSLRGERGKLHTLG